MNSILHIVVRYPEFTYIHLVFSTIEVTLTKACDEVTTLSTFSVEVIA